MTRSCLTLMSITCCAPSGGSVAVSPTSRTHHIIISTACVPFQGLGTIVLIYTNLIIIIIIIIINLDIANVSDVIIIIIIINLDIANVIITIFSSSSLIITIIIIINIIIIIIIIIAIVIAVLTSVHH